MKICLQKGNIHPLEALIRVGPQMSIKTNSMGAEYIVLDLVKGI